MLPDTRRGLFACTLACRQSGGRRIGGAAFGCACAEHDRLRQIDDRQPLDALQSGRCSQRRQAGSLGNVAGDPAAQHQHIADGVAGGRIGLDAHRREHMKARNALAGAVVEKDRVRLIEATFDRDPLAIGRGGIKQRGADRQGRTGQRLVTLQLELRLVVGAPQLPVAKRHRQRHDRHSGQRGDHRCAHKRLRHVHPGTSGARAILEFMKIIIVIAFVAIIASLMSALFFMMRDKGQSRNTVRALTVRVALSACLFIFLLVANHFGWIQSQGVPIDGP